MALAAELRAFRLARARALGVPAYCVFSNKVLDALVAARPASAGQLLRVPGISRARVSEIGDVLLEIIGRHADEGRSIDREVPLPHGHAATADVHSVRTPLQLDSLVNVGDRWSRADDEQLWQSRQHPVELLAAQFSRSKGAIRARLKHLENTEHTAHQRLFEATRNVLPTKRCSDAPDPLVDGFLAHRVAASTAMEPGHRLTPEAQAELISKAMLNTEQQAASDRALRGENCFFTGPAGSGKSFLLRYVIQELCCRYPDGVAITASTGIAASHIGGTTIHSFAGIGLGKGGMSQLIEKVTRTAAALARWRKLRVLVVDEVSMLDSELFTTLEAVARETRRSGAPFGGVQLVLSGDFFQLPPVSLAMRGVGFAFESPAWKSCKVSTVPLAAVVRQAGDPSFIKLLNEVRLGLCTATTSAILTQCHIYAKPPPADGIVPTKLYCKNAKVDDENLLRLSELEGVEVSLEAVDVFQDTYSANVRQELCEKADKKAPKVLRLKRGAQVVLTKNEPGCKLVNGSRGVVMELSATLGTAVVKFDSGVLFTVRFTSSFQACPGGALIRHQLPLKLAWALTVHKAQGMTLTRAELQLDDAFDYGQVYVALSRVTSLSGLWIRGGNVGQAVVKAHPRVIAFNHSILQSRERKHEVIDISSTQHLCHKRQTASAKARPDEKCVIVLD